jgi:hypothetical protein
VLGSLRSRCVAQAESTTPGRELLGAALAAALYLASAGTASADLVELTTGEKIRGTVTRATATGIVIDVKGRERAVEQRLVRQITFDRPAPTTPSPPSPETAETPAPPTPAGPEARDTTGAVPSAPVPAEPTPTPTAPPAAAEAKPPIPPLETALDLDALEPQTLREAMRKLVELHSATADGVDHDRYRALTDEVNASVERYLRDAADGRAELKLSLAAAVRLYAFAGTAWNVFDAKGDLSAVGRAPAIGECPRLRQAIERDAARWKFKADDPAFAGLIAGSEGLRDLWSCAADRINEAARLIAKREADAPDARRTTDAH